MTGQMLDEKGLIDALLNDAGFRKIAEDDIGKVSKVTVDWEARTIFFKGARANKLLKIDDALEVYRVGVH